MLGKRYIFDFIVKKHKSEQNELAFKIYVTDCLGALAKVNKRYWDIIKPADRESQRTSEDVIASICSQIEEIGGKEEE